MMKSVDAALAAIRREVRTLGREESTPAGALGRTLAEAIRMDADSPPFDRALLDGFAVRSADATAGARLSILGRQDAGGAVWSGTIGAGQSIGINTGGVLPAGADAVLMVEQSEVGGSAAEPWVRVLKSVAANAGVQRRGAQGKAGEVALPAGTRLGSAAIAAGIQAGAEQFAVWRRAMVAVLSTGDELVAPGAPLMHGQIRNSNGPMLAALVTESGQVVLDLGSCGDVREDLLPRLERGLSEADVLLVTGGMSMGTRDLVPPLLKELGVEVHVEKVLMKPGKPFLFGTVEREGRRRYVAGLPGNPVSAFVTFQLFVRELLELLAGGALTGEGAPAGSGRFRQGVVEGSFAANGGREFYEPCRVVEREGRVVVMPLEWRGSADILGLSRANGLVKRAVDAPAAGTGELVDFLPI